MASGPKSREHHWWPVGLQSYWTDRNGDLSWINPDGKVEKKRAKNRKIAKKAHGHTLSRGSVWETNFEDEFSIDDRAHEVVKALSSLKPLGYSISEFFNLLMLRFRSERHLRDTCKFYHLDENTHRNLLLLIFSLLIRSPANRSRYENYPSLIGLPPDEEVGKANMRQTFLFAKKLCEKGLLSNQYFILIHSPLKKFNVGDGYLDWLTSSVNSNRINGRALLPLTPHLCVYFCTPNPMRSTPNCASFVAATWIVDKINEFTQIYSRDYLFFIGTPPTLMDHFIQRQFLTHGKRTDELIDMLDEVAGAKRIVQKGMISFGP